MSSPPTPEEAARALTERIKEHTADLVDKSGGVIDDHLAEKAARLRDIEWLAQAASKKSTSRWPIVAMAVATAAVLVFLMGTPGRTEVLGEAVTRSIQFGVRAQVDSADHLPLLASRSPVPLQELTTQGTAKIAPPVNGDGVKVEAAGAEFSMALWDTLELKQASVVRPDSKISPTVTLETSGLNRMRLCVTDAPLVH